MPPTNGNNTKKRKLTPAFFNEEAELRKKKLQDGIQQQKELHELRMEAARFERDTAKAKAELAQLELLYFKNKHL